jgi:predicted  nucleic acid-binding Zn-ribbon protein
MNDLSSDNILVRISEIEARAKSNSHRIDRLEKDSEALNRLAISVEVLAGEQKNLIEKIGSVDKKVGELERVPRDRWNNTVGYILSSACASIITALIARFLGS